MFNMEDSGEITTEELITELLHRKANRVGTSSEGTLGEHLVDANGMTLYLFTNDDRNVSNCSGGCAVAWPPVLSDGTTIAAGSVNESRLGTIQRQDGGSQVTYNGKPLYRYSNDEKPGDANGQDLGGVWFVVSTNGGAIFTNAPVNATEHGDFGTILTDASGRSLYLLTKDERNATTCTGGCALAWPPLITVENPVAGEGVDQGRLGTIGRSDGSNQVTYNGKSLYYFAADEKPGDANGQDLGGVWFVVTTNGGPLYSNAPVKATENDEMGTIITDASGRSLYLLTNDDPNVSNCSGGCALAWPPLITVDDPAPADEVSAARVGTITRADGSKQVTFDGNPLYNYAADEKPGDAMGQGLGGVWFVIDNAQPLMIILGEQNASGQTGTAVLSGRGTFTNVSLSLSAGSLETELVHIHAGQCAPGDLGGVVHALASFGGGSGASLTNVLASLDSLKTGDFAINTHQAGEASVYTSCGNVPTADDSLNIALAEMNSSGQSGFATLTARGDQTDVVLSATAEISELNHIHAGSCRNLGGVTYGLTNMASGTSATTVDATLASLMTGGFAVNLHKAGDPSVYTSCGNLPATTDSMFIVLGEMNSSGQTGTAALYARGDKTEVVLSATAGISELNHIHTGSCSGLGGVANSLTAMGDGTSVTTIDATFASLMTGGFAVNLHKAGEASVYTSCGNIPTTSGLSNTIAFQDFGWAPDHEGATGSVTYMPVASSFVAAVSVEDLKPDHAYDLYVMDNDLTGATNLDTTTYKFTTDASGAATIHIAETYTAQEGAPLPAFQVHFLVVDPSEDLTGTLPNPFGIANSIPLACSFPLGFLQLSVPAAPAVSLSGDSVPLFDYGWAPDAPGGTGNVSYTGQNGTFEATVTVGDLKPDHEYILFMMSSALNGEKTITEMPLTTDDTGAGTLNVSHTFDVPDGVPLPALQVHFLVIDRSEAITNPTNPFAIENPIVLACLFPLGFIQF